ncbi:MAG: agmatine deiminase family protein, partial [Rhodospirillales bacterium]|nr:agmatine deiminase family protein [Rhodospirillales bacterium]
KHPRIEQFDQLPLLDDNAAARYRLPAEFEPQRRVWVSAPHNDETWPNGTLASARLQFAVFVDVLSRAVEVRDVGELDIATSDSWIRDYGPLFVVRRDAIRDEAETEVQNRAASPRVAIHDFRFNSWGGKYDPPEVDDVVPQRIAAEIDLPLWVHNMVLEGGSIDVNGQGTLLTTEQCLLNPNRNPDMTRAQIEAALHNAFGVTNTIWLPGGIEGDDTDGHIDDLARFISPGTIAAIRAPRGHADHDVLERNWQVLQTARDQDGQPFSLMQLPVPDPLFFDYPGDRFTTARREQLPASYANFLICNENVFLPTFGMKQDDVACHAIEQALPDYRVVPVRSETLVVGQG